jgi:hypothetical protein
MDAVRVLPLRTIAPTIRVVPIRLNAGAVIFWLAAGAYLLIASFTVLALNIVPGDSLSRVGIAERVLFSRDPHLEAIGFVWNPLQSLPLLPLIPLKFFWPDMVRLGFAAAIASALFMAGAVYQVHATLRDFGVGRLPRLVLTVLFGIHPMIVVYAVNGMSEAMLLFFLLIATRQLATWLVSFHPPRLAYAGLALGGAYLSRYEAIAPAMAAIVVVLVASFIRSRGQREDRGITPICDTLIIATPVVATFALWALASWIIVGHPFEPFTSAYGNASQVQLGQHQGVAATLESAQGWVPAATLALRRVLVLEPFALILLVLASVVAFRRREPRLVVPLAVFGAVLTFMLVGSLMGVLFGWLRFFIAVVPAATLVIGITLPGPRPTRLTAVTPATRRGSERLLAAVGTAALLGLAASALPVAALGMGDPTIARSESDELTPIFQLIRHPDSRPTPLQRYVTEREVAQAVDSLGLHSGAVLIDTFTGYSIVLYSARPSQFIIPSDRDWKVMLSDPASAGVQYLLVPSPSDTRSVSLVGLDEINRTYPDLYETGGGVGRLIRTFDSSGESASWRLFRVTPQSAAAGPGS